MKERERKINREIDCHRTVCRNLNSKYKFRFESMCVRVRASLYDKIELHYANKIQIIRMFRYVCMQKNQV